MGNDFGFFQRIRNGGLGTRCVALDDERQVCLSFPQWHSISDEKVVGNESSPGIIGRQMIGLDDAPSEPITNEDCISFELVENSFDAVGHATDWS